MAVLSQNHASISARSNSWPSKYWIKRDLSNLALLTLVHIKLCTFHAIFLQNNTKICIKKISNQGMKIVFLKFFYLKNSKKKCLNIYLF